MRYVRCAILACVATLGIVPARADAQALGTPHLDRVVARPSLDYFVSRQHLAPTSGSRQDLEGVGGRIMWPLAALAGDWYHPVLSRTSVGAYVAHTGEASRQRGVWDYGAQADVRLTNGLLAGWFDPVLSLGVGSIHREVPGMRLVSAPYVLLPEGWSAGDPLMGSIPSLETTLPPRTERVLTAKPGVGARIHLSPSVDLRADVYRPIGLRDSNFRGLELSGGISLRA